MGIYSSLVTSDVASVGTSFDKTKFHLHKLNTPHPERVPDQPFAGRVGALHIKVTSIVSATKITARLVIDSDGDLSVVPDTEATIATGLTTTNSGCVAYEINIPFDNPTGTDNMWLMLKVDAGSVTLAQSCLSWSD